MFTDAKKNLLQWVLMGVVVSFCVGFAANAAEEPTTEEEEVIELQQTCPAFPKCDY